MNWFVPSDLVVVYSHDGSMVGHMWYSTFLKIHGDDWCMKYRLEYSKWNCPENVEEWEEKNG